MVIERLPARFRTRAVARAVTSPSALLLAGGGMAAAILGGLPIAAAAAVGAVAWVGRVALAGRGRGPKEERIDPFAVGEPWRRFVKDAQQAEARFDRAVRGCRPGPLRDRLTDVRDRIRQGVRECWRIALQGHALQGALKDLDINSVDAELSSVEVELEHAGREGERRALERTRDALRAQQAAHRRLRDVWNDARDRVRVLNAQLDEAVAQAIELSVGTADADAAALSPVAGDVDTVVNDLEALRQALEETGRVARGGGTG
jgi:hypothetical protein